MLIQADPSGARGERDEIESSLRDVLARRGDAPPLGLGYPGTYAYAFDLGTVAAAVVADGARASLDRARSAACESWPVDLPPPEPHLQQSLARAVSQLPGRPDRDPPDVRVVPWGADDRAVACAAACRLAEVWPAMLDELQVMVRQVALIEGRGIAGFTDIATQGAIFVNRLRLGPGRDGLSGTVRLAESLVHEGTHVRCHAAAWSVPVLVDPSDRSTVARTPLRPDPRPVNGLFQQLVVVARCSELYDRLAAAAGADPSRSALRARRDTLREQTRDAIDTLREHRDALTDHGMSVVEDAAAALASV